MDDNWLFNWWLADYSICKRKWLVVKDTTLCSVLKIIWFKYLVYPLVCSFIEMFVCQCLRILHIYLREECSWDDCCVIRKGSYVQCGLILNGTHECRACVNIFVSGMRTNAQCYSRWVAVGSARTLLHAHFSCNDITLSLRLQHRMPSNRDLKIAMFS